MKKKDNMKSKVLVDLTLGYKGYGFSGIPQDTRFLFAGLLGSRDIDSSGLILPVHTWEGGVLNSLESQSILLGPYLQNSYEQTSSIVKIANKINPSFGKVLRRVLINCKKNYTLYPVNSSLSKDLVWRNYFYKTIDAKKMDILCSAKYMLSSVGLVRMNDSVLRGARVPFLNTYGYDFALFQDSRTIKVSSSTRKVIRYHDGLPIFASDTVNNGDSVKLHYRSVIECEKQGALFVCNSPSSVDDLAKISDAAASRATVIPYFIPKVQKQYKDFESFMSVARVRISSTTMGSNDNGTSLDKWFGNKKQIPKFIMTLSTIEPRKNITGLINAWQRLRYQYKNDVKLLIVGSPGWHYESTLAAMRPFVKSGDLLHLEKVAQHELGYLYSAASCFAFPSFGEGFGLPPTEAMQCGCPVVVSDIPAHRYASGKGAIYCDPYDEDDIASKLAYVCDDSNRSGVEQLIQNGYNNVERFSSASVLPMWEEFFDCNKQ